MIVVECNADQLLMECMGFPKRQIDHAGCKGKVVNRVKKLPKAVGIIDEDPGSEQPGELKNYKASKTSGTIKFLENKNDKGKCLIQISPDLEHWVLKRAKANNIKPKDFSLPDNPKDLHSLTGIKKSKYPNFLIRLIDSDIEIKKMQEWIRQFIK
ncbi:MAG: hypothetical protein QG657_1932 [Acidobacteriota bacterium]|nr:hypothetical protein [Acidobacteriota bacterium]